MQIARASRFGAEKGADKVLPTVLETVRSGAGGDKDAVEDVADVDKQKVKGRVSDTINVGRAHQEATESKHAPNP